MLLLMLPFALPKRGMSVSTAFPEMLLALLYALEKHCSAYCW